MRRPNREVQGANASGPKKKEERANATLGPKKK